MLSATKKGSVNATLTRAGGTVRMSDGTDVRIQGRLDWYAPRGELQLRMTAIDPSYTLGQLELARAELLGRLQAEGLLRANAAHALPLAPLRVGLITSEGSAAEADFLDELRRSGFAFHVLRVDSRVQGADAPRSIANAIRMLATHRLDVLALVRGGGARTDLASFDDEAVARAIAACPVPVLTGVGHEVDISVADEVAHTSAKTPTACAQLLVARVGALAGALEGTWAAIAERGVRTVRRHDDRLVHHARHLARGTRVALDSGEVRLTSIADRSRRAAVAGLDRASHHLDAHRGRMIGATRSHLRAAEVLVAAAERRVAHRAPRALSEAERALSSLEARLRALDPDRTLARGWSITRARMAPSSDPPPRCSRATSSPPASRGATCALRCRPMADEEIGYADALAELEAILEEIEDDAVDVDVLAAKVKRGAELLRVCRGRITAAKVEVTQIVAELDPDATSDT